MASSPSFGEEDQAGRVRVQAPTGYRRALEPRTSDTTVGRHACRAPSTPRRRLVDHPDGALLRTSDHPRRRPAPRPTPGPARPRSAPPRRDAHAAGSDQVLAARRGTRRPRGRGTWRAAWLCHDRSPWTSSSSKPRSPTHGEPPTAAARCGLGGQRCAQLRRDDRLAGRAARAPGQEVPLSSLLVKHEATAKDETIKALFEHTDGSPSRPCSCATATAAALCVSSQSGCPLTCTFCATGA
jgi:hypothetical protein